MLDQSDCVTTWNLPGLNQSCRYLDKPSKLCSVPPLPRILDLFALSRLLLLKVVQLLAGHCFFGLYEVIAAGIFVFGYRSPSFLTGRKFFSRDSQQNAPVSTITCLLPAYYLLAFPLAYFTAKTLYGFRCYPSAHLPNAVGLKGDNIENSYRCKFYQKPLFPQPSTRTQPNPKGFELRWWRSAGTVAAKKMATTPASLHPASHCVPSSSHSTPLFHLLHFPPPPVIPASFSFPTSNLGVHAIIRDMRVGDPVLRIGHPGDSSAAAPKLFVGDTKSSFSGTFLNHIRLVLAGQESCPYQLKDGDLLQMCVDYQGGSEEECKNTCMARSCVAEWRDWVQGSAILSRASSVTDMGFH